MGEVHGDLSMVLKGEADRNVRPTVNVVAVEADRNVRPTVIVRRLRLELTRW